MILTHRMGWLTTLIVILFLSSLACNLPGRNASQATALPTIPVSNEAIDSLQDILDSAKDAFENNQTVDITVTESQLTSLAAIELESDPNLPLRDPQIYLRDGQVSIFASLTQNQIAVPVEIVLELSTDGQGNLKYEIIKGQLGPLPVPSNIMNRLTSRLDQIIDDKTSINGQPVYVESISVGDGNLNLRGYKR